MPSGNNPRTYSIATDTASAALNAVLLQQTIDADAGLPGGMFLSEAGDVVEVFGSLTGPEQATLDGVVAAHPGTATKAINKIYESNPVQSTALETWQSAFSKTAPALAAGTYRIAWSIELHVASSGATDSAVQVRFSIGGNVVGNADYDREGWCVRGSFDRHVAQEADTPVLHIEFRRDPSTGGDDTAEVRRMKISVEPVAELE